MSALQAFVLALVQGITEFLPISSTAHLILVPYFVGWPDQGLLFDMATHVGTLLAVIVYFRRDLAAMARSVPDLLGPRVRDPGSDAHLLVGLVLGTVPVAAGGLLLAGFLEDEARNAILIATTSIVFGLLLGWADWKGRRTRDLPAVTWRDALVVGLFQALALVPGTSRSGITITAALFLGLTRPAAARYSFLLSIPVMLLVAGKTGYDLVTEGAERIAGWPALGIGFAVSAITAYLAIAWLLRWLERQSLQVFVVYRVALGLAIYGLWAVRL